MHELSRENPRFGYRRITKLVRRGGQRVNKKRIHRLWKQAGLQVPTKKRKRRRLGTNENGSIRLEATRPNQVWSYDFVYDRTEDGKQLKLMPVIDEFTRECHAIEVGRSITSREVVCKLEELFERHGRPAFIRSDNGPEFVAETVENYLKDQGTETRFIDPGAPWQNSHVESTVGKLRDELLDRELFTTLLEAKVLAEQYRTNYNEHRPHSALGYETPTAFAATYTRKVNQEPALALT